ncbi:hypothetical protein ORI20_01560 [Mycobacterium sp. CVI_P3]|uniref:Lipoprotein LpqN n=1 Tax=Mycobacterium pinniadriaticum TaxID=2994102 RepID=A0ABT3S6R8_9MYCO|nr:hypothetical protein [Mycobacterium pinniadriaticum]MCX2928943.1 hypothetical protein [Mycobacterium pinniadriaticum]MCX2935190.1 hypothetical protein [Mycobacterium pinniadriaticum]
MRIAQTTTAGLFAAALLVGTAAVGCGSDDKESTSTSSSSSAAATTSAETSETTSDSASPSAQADDYSNLLLKASDIDPSFTASEPTVNPNGVPGIGQTMTNPEKKETILFAIFIDESPEAAVQSLQGFKDSIANEVTGEPQPADVGDGGFIASGTSPDGSKAITEVYFTQGTAMVNIEFESEPDDPILDETALAIAKMQDTQIANNLPA